MAVLFLVTAILFEVGATLCLKLSDGLTKLWPTIGTAVGYVIAFALVAQALRTLEVGVVYAVWSGVGTALITLIGIAALGESAGALKMAGVALIVVGVVALNLDGGAH
jgi:small multidrug resistance pump